MAKPPANADPLAAHAAAIRACRLCATVVAPPIAAAPVTPSRLLLVGQAPGPHEYKSGRLFSYTAGRRLFSWFASLGVAEEDFRAKVWMSAVLRCFPGRAAQGGDRVPAPAEIAACAPFLAREFEILRPWTVIVVGSLAMQRFLPAAPLSQRVGQVFQTDVPLTGGPHSCEIVPLPHPSGRSTWINAPENARLLTAALDRLARSRGWLAAFPPRHSA
jgi:uracil-DNA glycosylase